MTKKSKKHDGNDHRDKRDLKDKKDSKDKIDTKHKNLDEEKSKETESANQKEQGLSLKAPKELSTNYVSSEKDTYLFVVPVTLTGSKGQSIDTFAMLDNVSTDTMMRDKVADQLDLKGPEENVNVGTVLDTKKESVEGRTASLSVSARDGTNSTTIKQAFVVPSNKFNMPAQPRPPDPSQSDLFSQLKWFGVK